MAFYSENENSKNKIYKALGVSGNSNRDLLDFYSTDPKAIDDLLKLEKLSRVIYEPACGNGVLSEKLIDRGYEVISSDLVYRGYEKQIACKDFLANTEIFKGDIVTNPPYQIVDQFIIKCLESVSNGAKICLFLKLLTLEGQKRFEEIYKNNPPIRIHVYSYRMKCFKGGFNDSASSAIAYAWYVWEKGFKGMTSVDWIYRK